MCRSMCWLVDHAVLTSEIDRKPGKLSLDLQNQKSSRPSQQKQITKSKSHGLSIPRLLAIQTFRKSTTPVPPRNSVVGNISKGNENTVLTRYLHTPPMFVEAFFHNSQDAETTYVSISGSMDKESTGSPGWLSWLSVCLQLRS